MKLLAQETLPSKDPLNLLKKVQEKGAGFGQTDLPTIVANIIAALLSIVGLVLLGLIVYGGFIWFKARGNEKEVERAKNIMTDAIIGLVIVMIAYALSKFVVCSVLKATGAPILCQ